MNYNGVSEVLAGKKEVPKNLRSNRAAVVLFRWSEMRNSTSIHGANTKVDQPSHVAVLRVHLNSCSLHCYSAPKQQAKPFYGRVKLKQWKKRKYNAF